jgi:hypothetical protein
MTKIRRHCRVVWSGVETPVVAWVVDDPDLAEADKHTPGSKTDLQARA